MSESSFLHGWVVLLGSLATIAIILTALGVMLGMVRPANAAKHLGGMLGIVIVLILAPGIILSAWSAIPLWQKVALLGIGVAIAARMRPLQRRRNREDE
jgi:hypothetical protein